MIVYGIKNCDTLRKARKFLDSRAVQYQFHDFRQDGLHEQTVKRWVEIAGTSSLVNRRSTTWRQLSSATKADTSERGLIKLMVATPTVIKRPVIEIGDIVIVGFDKAALDELI